MSESLRARLFAEIDRWRLIDPHTHINPHAPAAKSLADLLGYHYYTELVHSAGVSRERIEDPQIGPEEKVERLVAGIAPLENTIQYSWLIEMAQRFFGFAEERVTPTNIGQLYRAAAAKMSQPDWSQQVLEQTGLDAVFLTNDFDDPLEGFDTSVYVPCLRTDDLVFHFAKRDVRARLDARAQRPVADLATLRQAIGGLFEHFRARGARAAAISLPPDFAPAPIAPAAAEAALTRVLKQGLEAALDDRRTLSQYIFWTLAEYCAEFKLPFDLMIGVNRAVYPGGVYQGQDLFDSRVSLIQYRELFNAFPQVTFPISVLASVTNQELVAYSWIFPNVVTNGHWWYSNTPNYIEFDAAARLEAVPQTKQVAYYSDMYKLEFALPKFGMYKRILAKILAERFVIDRGWSEERALGLARQVLRGNVERIFGYGE
ncbi:MAG: glucuronate isomerase [Planctomycetaceae bacterium]|nr:glucuronate isomerase [Planctomycetaceae bacterium]